MLKIEDARPPGPQNKLPLGLKQVVGMAADPLGFLARMAQYGDIVYYKAGLLDVFLVTQPEYVRDVLVTHQRNFAKGNSVNLLKDLIGNGVFTSDGEQHLRQRRMLQPSFHKERLSGYAQTMVSYSERQQSPWQDGAEIDLTEEMKQLTLAIVTKTLFDLDVAVEEPNLAEALNNIYDWAERVLLPQPVARLMDKLPLPSSRGFNRAKRYLDESMRELVTRRRHEGEEHGDLLSLLLEARDVEGNQAGMTNQQICDELLTFFLAGHETTALALMWAYYLLAQHPEVETKLHQELDRVLGNKLPELSSLSQLTYTNQVFSEALRLYPPAYAIPRYVVKNCQLGKYTLPTGAMVLLSPYLMHRDPRYFPEPEKFIPERWTAEFKSSLPKMAYFPFGAGSRLCIGEPFAWMEGSLVLATISQRWKMRLAPHQNVAFRPLVTLRSKYPIRMQLEKRSPLATLTQPETGTLASNNLG